VATRDKLITATDRASVDLALRDGRIVPVTRGRYALPAAAESVTTAHRLTGVLSLTSAALHHGWEVKAVPVRPHVTVRRQRRLSTAQAASAQVHYVDLRDDQVNGIATDIETTLEQCLRHLPEDEALAIADSALRHGVTPGTLRRVSIGARGPGAARMRRIASAARPEAANPFESVLRWIAGTVPGLHVEPQRLIELPSGWVRPDLVDEELRVVLEADSYEWHGGRAALARDSRRYNQMVATGWRLLRFAYEDVMFDEAHVRSLLRLVAKPAQGRCSRCLAA
jgi:very-short-patch-repair endonuclease